MSTASASPSGVPAISVAVASMPGGSSQKDLDGSNGLSTSEPTNAAASSDSSKSSTGGGGSSSSYSKSSTAGNAAHNANDDSKSVNEFIDYNASDNENLEPLVRIPPPAASENDSHSDQKAARSEGYAVHLVSGTELYLNKKSLLLANVAYWGDQSYRRTSDEEHYEFFVLKKAQKSAEEAEKALLAAREKLREGETELARLKQKKIDVQKKRGVARIAAGLSEIPSSEIRSEDEADEALSGAGGGEAEREKQHSGTSDPDNEESKIEAEPEEAGRLAGKRSREEPEESGATVTSENVRSGEPPKKAAKFDAEQVEAKHADESVDARLLGDDSALGGVSASNDESEFLAPSDVNLQAAAPPSEAPPSSELSNDDTNVDHQQLAISTSVLRTKVFECLNDHRQTEGQSAVPLEAMVFCIHTETGESLFEGETLMEASLLDTTVTIGIRFFPNLTFERFMIPFSILARSIGGSSIDVDVNTPAINANNNSGANKISGKPKQRDWWEQRAWHANGFNGHGGEMRDLEYSEEDATRVVASGLLTAWLTGGELRDFLVLAPPFFRQHPIIDSATSGEDGDLDADFCEVRSKKDWSFPSENAMLIAGFQLGIQSGADAGTALGVFPKWVAIMFAGLACHERPTDLGFKFQHAGETLVRKSVICFWRTLLRFTTLVPELTSTCWSWPPPASDLLPLEFDSPLTCTTGEFSNEIAHTLPVCTARSQILLKLHKISHGLATAASASDAQKESYWNLKQSIVGHPLRDEGEWRKVIGMKAKYYKDTEPERPRWHKARRRWQQNDYPRWEARFSLYRGLQEFENIGEESEVVAKEEVKVGAEVGDVAAASNDKNVKGDAEA